MKKITLLIAFSMLTIIGFSQPFNRFMNLDGVDDYAEDNFSGTNFPSGNFTLEFWIYSCESRGYSLIDAAGSTAGGGIEVRYFNSFGGEIIVSMRRTGSTYPNTSIRTTLGTNSWNHYALTYNATDSMAHTFVNGIPTDTVKVAAYIGASARFYLGRLDYTSSAFLKAQVDEMRISDTIRYSGGFSTQTSEFSVDNRTNALYHFNDTSINILDASPNNYHLMGKTPESFPVLVSNDTSGVISNITAGAISLCGIDSTTLYIDQLSQLYDNNKWVWYADSCNGVSLGEGDSVVVKPFTTTTYYARGEEGCAMNGVCNSITITVNPLPVVNANTTSTSVCGGSSITLFGTGTASSYFWNNNVQDGVAFIPLTSAIYEVTGTNGLCSNKDTISVVVNTLPQVTLAPFSTNSICLNASAVALPIGSPSGGTFFGTGIVGSNFDPAVAGVGTHQVIYEYTNANNCKNQDSASITVNQIPTVTANATAIALCNGDSVTLTATGTATSYIWNNSVQDGVAFVPTATASYIVTGTDGTCSNKDTISVTVNPLPQVTLAAFSIDTICYNSGAVALPVGSPVGGVYSGNGVVGSSFDPAVAGVGAHQIIYEYTNSNNCINQDSSKITVDLCVGLSEMNVSKDFSVYPNPFQNQIVLKNSSNESLEVEVIDLNGKRLFTATTNDRLYRIQTESFPKGVYLITVRTPHSLHRQKLIKY